MSDTIDVDRDGTQSIGQVTGRIVKELASEKRWNGKTITEPGVYSGISLADYHEKTDLFDGPAISKSNLKWLLPVHGGSPKAFWGRWRHNPNHIVPKSSVALDFGRAAHCLLLGDEVFAEKFVVRPEQAPDGRAWNGNNNSCKDWIAEQTRRGLTILTAEQIDTIRKIAADASAYPLVKLGVLNGRVERTMCWKDPETGIWLKARPDAMPHADGVFADLKTASKFEEDFLERQIFDACYYLQAAITRMVCRGLEIPFDTFALLYVLNDDVPDTAHVEMSVHEIDRGERAIRWCLRTIRKCLDSGEWPGAHPFAGGEHPIQMKPWAKESLDRFLERSEALESQAA